MCAEETELFTVCAGETEFLTVYSAETQLKAVSRKQPKPSHVHCTVHTPIIQTLLEPDFLI